MRPLAAGQALRATRCKSRFQRRLALLPPLIQLLASCLQLDHLAHPRALELELMRLHELVHCRPPGLRGIVLAEPHAPRARRQQLAQLRHKACLLGEFGAIVADAWEGEQLFNGRPQRHGAHL